MCQFETVVRIRRTAMVSSLAGALLVVFASDARAQVSAEQAGQSLQSHAWRGIGGYTINEGLAGPATGPVKLVWYSPAGNRLLAQTVAGRIFETSDFEHWRLNTSDQVPDRPTFPSVVAFMAPEPEARIQQAGNRLYATGPANLHASDDNGRTWLNLTGFNNRSIIGGGFTALAVSPVNSQEITAANQFGVWRSVDGGLSWRGINEELPNLRARRLLNRRMVVMADSSLVGFDSGAWTPLPGTDPEVSLRSRFTALTGLRVSSVVSGAGILYMGTVDGMLFTSRDNGTSWSEAERAATGAIDRIWVASDRPDSALAAAGTHLLRTINGGAFWDDVTGTLPAAIIHGIAADAAAGVVYLATDRGVFSGTVPLNDAGAAGSDWKTVSGDLPAAVAWDVRLNQDNTLTVALDGYGIFETQAPHRPRTLRIVNGADMSDRPAAPGSLISILGANVRQGKSGTLSYPVLAASAQSSQLQVPFEAPAGILQIALDGPTGSTDRWSVPLTVRDASPAIFVDSGGAPLLLDSASGLVVDPNVAIHSGSLMQILATGLGKVTPDWATGVPAPLDSPPAVRGTVTAYLDGTPVQVTRATLAPGYVGYYIVELQIPSIVNRGMSELRILMNGEESNRVKLYLEPDRALQ
jgi:uncharacterized protein (TIGR03437 family)